MTTGAGSRQLVVALLALGASGCLKPVVSADDAGQPQGEERPDAATPTEDAGPRCLATEVPPGACDDRDVCTSDGFDLIRGCVHAARSCPAASSPCQQAACDGGCVLVPAREGERCDEGSSCGMGSFCRSGRCLSEAVPDGGACRNSPCESGTCSAGSCVARPALLKTMWTYRAALDGGIDSVIAADHDGNAYFVERVFGGAVLVSLDPAGAVRFQTPLGEACWPGVELDAGIERSAWLSVVGDVVVVRSGPAERVVGVSRMSGALLWSRTYEDLINHEAADAGCPSGTFERAPFWARAGAGLMVGWRPKGCETVFISQLDVQRGTPHWVKRVPHEFVGDEQWLGFFFTGIGKDRVALQSSRLAVVSSDGGFDLGASQFLEGWSVEAITGADGTVYVVRLGNGLRPYLAYSSSEGLVGSWAVQVNIPYFLLLGEQPLAIGEFPPRVNLLSADGGVTVLEYPLVDRLGVGNMSYGWALLADGGLLPYYRGTDGGDRIALHQPGQTEAVTCSLPDTTADLCPVVQPLRLIVREGPGFERKGAVSAFAVPGLEPARRGRTQVCAGSYLRNYAPLE